MPLGKDVSANIRELTKDNKRKGKSRGANGKKRSRKQIIAISLHAAGKSNNRASHRPSVSKTMKRKMGFSK